MATGAGAPTWQGATNTSGRIHALSSPELSCSGWVSRRGINLAPMSDGISRCTACDLNLRLSSRITVVEGLGKTPLLLQPPVQLGSKKVGLRRAHSTCQQREFI